MGTLYYGSGRTAVTIDDRILAHLKILIVSKLRRGEPFMVSWNEHQDEGFGRSAVWIHPGLDLIFRFDGGRVPDLDKKLLDQMSGEAIGPMGIQIEASMGRFWGR